jgi:hypothetical protein
VRYYSPRILENLSKQKSKTQRKAENGGCSGRHIPCSRRWCAHDGRRGSYRSGRLRRLEGDRYCAGTGHWSRFGRVCEVTFIAAEDLDDIERETGVSVKNGEHRRNVVTRGINLKSRRRGQRFGVGEVVFEYRGPRSVCRYIERLTEVGMTQALKGRGGICARVIKNGAVRVGDEIELL